MSRSRTLLIALSISVSGLVQAVPRGDGSGHAGGSHLSVSASRSSAFVTIQLHHHRKIGVVTMEVKDGQGRTLYREEGKAMQDELVRRLDKGILPRGEHTLVVTSKDLTLTERFTVE
ncbi:MAG: hypothetical protein IPO05_06645 [Flavobacteriales bacterium]|jgi:hypothetical protein|nr:hypothetical protein [Flavobacteriales bacterium]MBK9513301.1 hypothetical protein [Flavobacteriales bacterium]MBP7449477.1 hypothetical protein [Flavobacteriales bacterium]